MVRRPAAGERETVAEGVLDTVHGLVGDRWSLHSNGTPPSKDTQLTLMNSRFAALVAGRDDRWELAGDQLYVDLDLSPANIPPGTRLQVGTALVEVSDAPHTGCGKFIRRFGIDAAKLANSQIGRELNLRGINAMVITGGVVRPGDAIAKA